VKMIFPKSKRRRESIDISLSFKICL